MYVAMALCAVIVAVMLVAGCSEKPGSANQTMTKTTAGTKFPESCVQNVNNVSFIILINPISLHSVGDVFEINGTTNLGIDGKIPVDVYGGSHSAPYPGIPGKTYGTNGIARIWCGNSGINFWNFSVNSSRFNINFYFVRVETRNISATNFSRFEMKMYLPTVF